MLRTINGLGFGSIWQDVWDQVANFASGDL